MLRNLIIGKYMPKFDYLKTKFTFRTVFYRDSFSYCICDCGIHHEYLDYIDDSGDIDEGIFNRVVACIDKGQCPHVSNVDSKFVTNAQLSPLHVIAASGSSTCVENKRKFQNFTLGGYMRTFAAFNGRLQSIGRLDRCRSLKHCEGCILFLTPFDITVLKNRKHVPVFGRRFYVDLPILTVAWIPTEDQGMCVQFDADQFQKMCMQNQNYNLLNYIMDNMYMSCEYVDQVLQTAFQLNNVKVIESIVNSHNWFGKRPKGSSMNECCELAILYDKPEYLRHFLENFPDRTEYKASLFNMCKALDRDDCLRVILEVAGPNDNPMPKSSVKNRFAGSLNRTGAMTPHFAAMNARILALTRVLGVEECYDRFSEQPGTSDARASDPSTLGFLNTELINGRRCLRSLLEVISPFFTSLADDSEEKLIICLWSNIINTELSSRWFDDRRRLEKSYFWRRLRKSASVEAWLRSLVDVTTVYKDGMTPLLELLDLCKELGSKVDIFKFRQCLELYINQNPDVEKNRSAVGLALEIDQMIYENEPVQDKWTGTYIVDGRNHGMFGHDDNLALNMTVPLLIESGFPVPDSLLDTVITHKDTIPPEVYEYIQATRGHPKPLEVVARDCLRRYYRGRQIHRFVDCANLPQILKDFILLKPLLKSVPETVKFLK